METAGLNVMENGFLGSSPDGMVHESGTGEQCVVEVKCPSSAADMSLVNVAKKSSHFCAKVLDGGTLSLKHSHTYFYHIQENMAITACQWCDFVLWSPTAISVERIAFNENQWSSMHERLR